MRTLSPAVALLCCSTVICAITSQGSARVAPGDLQQLPVETLGTPIRSARMEPKSYLIPNSDGKSYDLIQIYYRTYGGPNTIVIADLGTSQIKTINTQRGYNFHLAPSVVAGGKLYISTLGIRSRQELCVYDPATNDLKLNAIDLPDHMLGETHPMKLGTDGKIYIAGGHPSQSAAVCQLDPATGRVTDYGAVGPSHKPNDCWAYTIAADDTHVYVASGKVPWHLVAYEKATGKSEVLISTDPAAAADAYMSVAQGRYGCTAKSNYVAGTDGKRIEYWLHNGKAIEKKAVSEPPPWKEPETQPAAVTTLAPPEVARASAVPDNQGNCTIWWRPAQVRSATKPSPEAAPAENTKNTDDETPPAPAADEAALAAEGWKPLRFNVSVYPIAANRLTELPDGRIFGMAGYEGQFVFDPKTGKSEHLGKLGLSPYALTTFGNKLYISGYSSAPVYEYDPTKTWTANTRLSAIKLLLEDDPKSNPRRVTGLEEHTGVHKMYAAAGANGKVYFGGRWYRNGSCGGLGWWDPKTGKSGGFWEPFATYQVNFITAADAGKAIVVSAHRVENAALKKPKPEQGQLFFVDTATDKIVGTLEPFPRIKGPGPILGVGGNRVVGWTENPDDDSTSILYAVDTAKRQVIDKKILPVTLPVKIGSNQTERWDYRLGPDGMIWTFLDGSSLVRIDPKDLSVHPVGQVGGGRLAFSGTDLYLGGAEELRKVKNLLK